jgi:competence protein ComEC
MYFSYMKILQFPLFTIYLGLLFGILLFQNTALTTAVVAYTTVLLLLTLIASSYYSQKNSLYIKIFGALTFFLAVTLGIGTALLHQETRNPNHYTHQNWSPESLHNFDIILTDRIKSTHKNLRYQAQVVHINHQKSFGKIIFILPKKLSKQSFKIGNHLLVRGYLTHTSKPINPDAFDYGSYLNHQEIYAQLYAKGFRVGSYESSIWSEFSNFREHIITNLEKSFDDQTTLPIVIALILGQQQDISKEIIKDYQYAGAIHVLSVSGLHVGFLVLFINTLLKPIGNSKKGMRIKTLTILITLWSFALLAGLAPSIIRSATMFSCITIGLYLRRTVNIYHTLIVSQVLILLLKPSFIYDVGFQLSYLAVFFIVWLQPKLAEVWTPKNKIKQYFWGILTVSFAAQIGTLPLSLYYFHQFPGLFFITNIIILPVLGIVMALGLIVVLIATIQLVPKWVCIPLEVLLKGLNYCIHLIASFDTFVFRNIPFTSLLLLTTYLVIIAVILWAKKPKYPQILFVLTSILTFQLCYLFQKNKTFKEKELIVYHIPRHTLLTERIGKKIVVYADRTILQNQKTNPLLQTYSTAHFSHQTNGHLMPSYLYFNNQKIAIIDSDFSMKQHIKPDICVLITSPKINLERVIQNKKPKYIIADGSNRKSYIALWKKTCRKHKIPFHATGEKGFYKL